MTTKHFVDEAGRYVETIVFPDIPPGLVEAPENAGAPPTADHSLVAGEWVAPPPPPPVVPETISDRQFAQGLAGLGLISEAEALAWVSSGALPAAIGEFVEAMPEDDRFPARMVLQGATSFERSHPFTAMFGAAVGMNDGDLDAFWIECAGL